MVINVLTARIGHNTIKIMDVRIILKTVKGDTVVQPNMNVESATLLQRYMQGFLTGYATFRKHGKVQAYDVNSGALIEAVSL